MQKKQNLEEKLNQGSTAKKNEVGLYAPNFNVLEQSKEQHPHCVAALYALSLSMLKPNNGKRYMK